MGSDQPLGSTFDELIGIEWLSDDPDEARVRVAVRDQLKQPFGLVHGGVFSTLVESICSRATAIQVFSDGKVAVGQSLDISFLRPITEGSVTVAARVRHRGRTSWVWEAEVRDDGDRVCALARMTIAIRPSEQAAKAEPG
jgi:1,4-dihydroxy-2-naphthoyl-CoA hydrolase